MGPGRERSVTIKATRLLRRCCLTENEGRCYALAQEAASIEPIHIHDQPLSANPIIEPPEDQSSDTVECLLTHTDDVARLMKMECKILLDDASRWFPYLDRFKCQNNYVRSGEILEAVGPCISDVRKERFRNVVSNRSYSLCLVVEGLSDFGNVSAVFRFADALGIQSVHVVSCDSSKRCKVVGDGCQVLYVD
ncbi:hypothetical protein K1719_030372 [Acacia pycnantha]|nr:hypothetical protein K1719_030372 [Acacia pycnantha]